MSNVDKWNGWFSILSSEPREGLYFGNGATYHVGADFLANCDIVEDWGTGTGAFKIYRPDAIGIDGSNTPHADRKEDLTRYKTHCDGIFIRHVLEHNVDWEKIIKNALNGARKKIFISIFTPVVDGDSYEIKEDTAENHKAGILVPSIAISRNRLREMVEDAGFSISEKKYPYASKYNYETVFFITKNSVKMNKTSE